MLAAVGVSVAGFVAAQVGMWWALLAAEGGGSLTPTIIGSSGSAVAVAALGYVVRAVLSGQLVARTTAERDNELVKMNARLSALTADSLKREDTLARLIRDGRGRNIPVQPKRRS